MRYKDKEFSSVLQVFCFFFEDYQRKFWRIANNGLSLRRIFIINYWQASLPVKVGLLFSSITEEISLKIWWCRRNALSLRLEIQ